MFTKEELDKVLDGIHEYTQKLYVAKDLEGILNQYHPDAVIIHAGKDVKYGKDDIRTAIKGYVETTANYKVFPSKRESTSDGEFLIEQGHFEVKTNSGDQMKANFEIVYKKTDGKYLVYHDLYSDA